MSTIDNPAAPLPRIVWGLAEISAATGIPLSTLRLEIECTPLKGAFLMGRRVCALPADVHAWLEQLRVKNAYTPRKNSREAA